MEIRILRGPTNALRQQVDRQIVAPGLAGGDTQQPQRHRVAGILPQDLAIHLRCLVEAARLVKGSCGRKEVRCRAGTDRRVLPASQFLAAPAFRAVHGAARPINRLTPFTIRS